MQDVQIRHDWSIEEIKEIYNTPLLELVFRAASVHRQTQDTAEVQVCTLLSIKTGGCTEDCAYCPQAARYNTDIKVHGLMQKDAVLAYAAKAREAGSTRFCMGAAWREVRDNRDFDRVLEMVKGVNEMGMEVCCTLGMLTEDQAQKLADAGLYAYNHNLDTSGEYYEQIITTRTYDDRLKTLDNVRKAGVSVCCGGIIGLGESHEDRIGMIHTLSNLPVHPDSVPINALTRVKGTPLENMPKVQFWDMVRMIATTRILMPKAMVRLSAGRAEMSMSEQALCFMAGANSIFTGEKLLTTANPSFEEDHMMFELLGLKPREAFKGEEVQAAIF
ncbi:MAG: bioB [Bacteroidetes bacterium]|uniref:biotin synthase BioB n=1 Tax=Chitinophaga TaxID=79328 RepID=UPI0009C86B6F|nr:MULTISPECIES: biotin synthase BioB [Chitinophaga]MBP1653115.1 bioB [Bacteroidota bacterium]OMP79086.1 biotin synthase BioB [[Flexibacter] sp. ATCC 35208]WPQ65707.1 biotin synthase BioB [Chitinophaga sancti]WPV70143.1 biotin synthase BioB [Chitinophaga sp. LS1]